MTDHDNYTGVTACVKYEDAGAMADWLALVFGFRERARYVDKDKRVRQVEMLIGDTEFWFSGQGPGYWEKLGRQSDQWVVVWVNDVDAQYARVRAAGIDAEQPNDPDDVHQFHVKDPEGCGWTFIRRTGRDYAPKRTPEQGGLEEIRPAE